MRTLTRVGLFAAMLALGAFALPSPAAANSSSGCSGFDGRWQTTWAGGMVTKMRITGTQGTYSFKGGTLSGRRSAGVFFGTYYQNDGGGSGHFHFWLSNSGNSFSGWYATAAHPDTHIAWKGACLGP